MQISATAQSIELARPDLYFPERLQQVVTRCLAKDPRMRFQRMEHLASELDACGRKGGDPLTISPGLRTSGETEVIHVEEAPSSSSTRFSLPVSLPVLCGGIAAVFAVGTLSWAVLTDMGKKDAAVKIPLTAAADWKNTCDEAQNSFNAGNYDMAEKQYIAALDTAKKFKQPDERVAKTLNNLAFVYDCEDKLDEARKCSLEAMSVARQLHPPNAALTADSMFNLCKINCEMDRTDEAAKYGRQALDLRKQANGLQHQDVAAAQQALAQVECKRKNYTKANQMLSEALAIAIKSLADEHPDVASILHDLGMVREKQGNLKGAEVAFHRALGMRQKQLGIEHPQVADTLCALGTLNFNMHKDAEAEHMFNNALSIRQKAFGEDSSRTAEAYACLAILYDSQRKFDKAEECYRKTVEIRQKVWGQENPRLIRSLQNLSRFLREHNQPHGAEVYEQQIKRIQTKAGETK
jgi:tetratricopeptide (TPR) repeat protein